MMLSIPRSSRCPIMTCYSNPLTMSTVERSAMVLGSSGAVGRQLIRYLLESKAFVRVVAGGRREFHFGDEPIFADLKQKIVDFEQIKADDLAGFDVVFCCLGTTRGKAGKDGFYKVDHDYIVNSARAAKLARVPHFSFVSAQGADTNSFFFYLKTKGETERDVVALDFDRLTIARPSVLQGGDRAETRWGEKFANFFIAPVNLVKPNTFVIAVADVAKAMIVDATRGAEIAGASGKVAILENAKLCSLAKEFAQQFPH